MLQRRLVRFHCLPYERKARYLSRAPSPLPPRVTLWTMFENF